jgi:type IV fimbrial biogenesis protein FimT
VLTARPASTCRPDTQRGFTLIELLVVMAIVAIGMSLAAPKMSEMIAARKVRVASQTVLDGLNIARAEAVRRNTEVRFALTSGGWTVTQVSDDSTLRSSSNAAWDSSLSIAPGGSSSNVTFLATGLRGVTGTQMAQVNVSSSIARAGSRRINIFGGGLIRMCDPDISAANDPRRC